MRFDLKMDIFLCFLSFYISHAQTIKKNAISVFESLRRFSPVYPLQPIFKTMWHVHTKNDVFSLISTFETVFQVSVFISVFHRCSVNDRRKQIEMYAFSIENAD